MATIWEKIRYYANEKVKRDYMKRVGRDIKCPNCKLWTSEVGGAYKVDYSELEHVEVMICRQCNYPSRWDCRGMIPELHAHQVSHKPKGANQ